MSIVLRNLTKRFGNTLVVNDVCLQVLDGELFVLLGGSGSGKSTLLRLIAGLLEPDEGHIELDGQDVTDWPTQARGVGFVFQNYSIFRHMTAAENIEFGLRIRHVPKEERKKRVEELLELVGLTGLGTRYADQLSGGQQQRVALARALAYQPAVLLLDEPFGALDVKIRAQMRQSLKEIQRRLKITTILVTHDQEEAFELADRIGVIDRGRLIEVGSPEDLYHRPQTEFVAAFLGSGNVLVGRALDQKIQLGAVTLPFPADAPDHDEGAPVRVLFRPESVVLQPEPFPPNSGLHVLGQGEVVERVFVGSLQRLRLEVEGLGGVRPVAPPRAYGQRTTPIEAVQPSEAQPVCLFTPGQKLWIGIRRYHILEPTGLKILICTDGSPAGEAAVEYGCLLAQAARGPATLLAVASCKASSSAMRDHLEGLHQRWQARLPRLETRLRQGDSTIEAILSEVEAEPYELVILGRSAKSTVDLDRLGRPLLERALLPVLLIVEPRPLKKILICTAAGEPGKAAVRFGGRLARHIGAFVTVLHVHRFQETPEERARVERHLCQAQASLEALGITSAVKIAEEPALERILREAHLGDYDLIILGAPSPSIRPPVSGPDLATQIVRGTTRPVLVVPMAE